MTFSINAIYELQLQCSTMNKKTLEKLTNHSNYNQDLFTAARTIVQNCQQLMNKTEGLTHEQKSSLKDKQQQLENALKNVINIYGKFVNIPKAPLATIPDHGLNIFEAITDNIQTSVQRYKEFHKNSKNKQEKIKQSKQSKQSKRPQDLYPFIKPAQFDFHNHEKNLQFIRTQLFLIKSRSLEQKYSYVSTPSQLQQMINELSKQSEIAVDVQHSNKSYQGLTCLIQISSRQKDYIIDVFPIWKEIPLLKRIMENQSIIKVMHGAQMDTKWLQRDFNIHILNLFDTHRASRFLGFSKLSYAYLLNYYCNVTTDKTYQLADWRQRPLSYQMLHYARLDTHYLLQIFDRLLSDLHQKALTMNLNPTQVITDVYATSYQVTKNEVELFDFRQKQFYQRLKKQTKQKQFGIFDSVFSILDKIAQGQDISFDELVNHKLQRQIISKIKQMIYLKNQDTKIKIDKFLSIFKQSNLISVFQDYLIEIKVALQQFFNNYENGEEKADKKGKKNRIGHLQEFRPIEEAIHKKQNYAKQFREYSERTYQCLHLNPFSMILFQPIMGFLSKKAGLSQKQEEQNEMEVEQSNQDSAEQQDNSQANNEQKQQEIEGIIQFKRLNPNVVYTIEQAEVVQQKHKPRKKRKQLDYEAKLKSKEANIFQLLED